MKREELKKILPEITDEQLDSVMNLHGNSVKDYKITIETLKSDIEVNKGIIKNQREKIGELENVDIEQIKNAEYERGKSEAAAEVEKVKFSHAVDDFLSKSGAKNSKAVKALLDMESIKLENDALKGIEEQIESIKAENGYLFDDKAEKPNFTNPNENQNGTDLTKEAFSKMGYTQRLQLYNDNPDLYNQLNE